MNLFVAALLTTVPAVAAQAPMMTCGGTFGNVEAILYPSADLTVGEEAYFYLSYTAPSEITDGYTITTFNVNGMPFPESKENLCQTDEASTFSIWRDDDTLLTDGTVISCPITVGTHATNSSFAVPNVDGQLKSKISWFSADGEMLLCVKMVVNVVAPSIVW